MRSLKIIQVLAKIIRIVCLVLFVIFIVASAACLTGMIVLPIIKDIVVHEGKTIAELMAENNAPFPVVFTAMTIGLLGCGAYIFLSYFNQRFFEEEIKVGTPFDHEIVKKMRINSIVNAAVTVGLLATAGIVKGILQAVFQMNFDNMQFHLSGGLFYAVCMILLSLFAEYGADLTPKPEVVEVEPEIEEEPVEESKAD